MQGVSQKPKKKGMELHIIMFLKSVPEKGGRGGSWGINLVGDKGLRGRGRSMRAAWGGVRRFGKS